MLKPKKPQIHCFIKVEQNFVAFNTVKHLLVSCEILINKLSITAHDFERCIVSVGGNE